MSNTFANYREERAAFGTLFTEDCGKRILLFKGASGNGKTSLLSTCLGAVPNGHSIINVQLRHSSVDVTEIFSRSIKRIGADKLIHFNECAADLAGGAPKIQVSGVQQDGETNNLRIALNVQDPGARAHHQSLLTEAWFCDVERLETPLLMVLDTYEQAPSEVQDWLSGPFLARTADCYPLRVVVAGQEVPEAGIEWGHCHTLRELYGVSDAREWLPVVGALGKKVPVEPAETYLAGICLALKGKPAEIMDVIKTFPNACNLMPEGARQ